MKTLMSPQFLGALVVAVALFLTAKRKIEEPDEEPEEEDDPSLPERVRRWGAGTSYSVGTRLKAR